MGITVAVLAGFALSLGAPWIHRVARGSTGWLLAVLPLGLTAYFAGWIGPISAGETATASFPWVPSLGIHFSFYLDGLGLLFALLITGIGALVLVYSGGYLAGHDQLGRFYAFLLMFMGSMLGLVLADNLITLFVFWELTSLSSYLLIGFDHEREASRTAALQALLVTGVGGLALLAGLLLMGQVGGSLELSHLLRQGAVIREHGLYLPILLLVLGGALTKSAQFPFHFWLPNAMEAPTPVSAYLHSATMVKAGIYLLARLSPLLAGTDAWLYSVATAGAVTMLLGAFLAYQSSDLKRMLAHSTVGALGMLTLLLGIGGPPAVSAAMVFLFGHALYKGGLFLVAGAIDHATGVREAERLGGLGASMPITATAAVLAALSMAGLPPLLGFIGKEMVYEAIWGARHAPLLLTGATLVTSILFVAVAGVAGVRPFIRSARDRQRPHEPPISLWIGPVLLSVSGLIVGLVPGTAGEPLISPAVAAVLGGPETARLALWHGMNPTLALSVMALAGGVGIYLARARLAPAASRVVAGVSRWGSERWYSASLDAVNGLARAQTRWLQSGYLRYYLLMIVATMLGSVGYTLASLGGARAPSGWSDLYLYELVVAALILLAAGVAVRSRSRLGAVAALGVVGYGQALIYILFGAPDLAMTQFLVETLMVILFVLVFYHLPRFAPLSGGRARAHDALIALATGGLMATLVLIATAVQLHPAISDYFAEQSLAQAHGRNVVNVILVDFRALDTLGEITVLAVAGIGVYALLKLRSPSGRNK